MGLSELFTENSFLLLEMTSSFQPEKNNNKQDNIETSNQHGIQSQSTQLTFVVGWQFSAFIMNINLDILSVCWPIERILHLKCTGRNGGNGGKVKKGSSKTLNSWRQVSTTLISWKSGQYLSKYSILHWTKMLDKWENRHMTGWKEKKINQCQNIRASKSKISQNKSRTNLDLKVNTKNI